MCFLGKNQYRSMVLTFKLPFSVTIISFMLLVVSTVPWRSMVLTV